MTEDIWTVRRILEWIEGYLSQHGDEHPRLSAQWLVAEALDMSRMRLFMEFDRPLNPDERAVLRDWTRRRGAGEPLQYITGTVGFRHITVKVRPGVLIPRPETELLVSEALALLPAAPKPQDELDAELLRQFASLAGDGGNGSESDGGTVAPEPAGELLVADICTGTGCIACSIAHEHPLARVIATDIAPEAVELARANVAELDLQDRVTVIECDLCDGIDVELVGSFDLVVSNPPYVPTSVLAGIPSEVADFEPVLALDGGDDGLDMFRRLIAWCSCALKPGGAFAFELHETRLDAAAALAAEAGFCAIGIVNDLAEKPRVLMGRKPMAS